MTDDNGPYYVLKFRGNYLPSPGGDLFVTNDSDDAMARLLTANGHPSKRSIKVATVEDLSGVVNPGRGSIMHLEKVVDPDATTDLD